MSENLGLGKLIITSQHRDAVHIAVAPVTASERLRPGQQIDFVQVEIDNELVRDSKNGIGIVDPFLKSPVEKGQKFWMWLNPGSITSLRHDWTHPAFKDDAEHCERLESEEWLKEYCHDYRADYKLLIQACVEGSEYCFGSDYGPPNYSGCEDEFWQHVENVTGRKFDSSHRENTYFRCAC